MIGGRRTAATMSAIALGIAAFTAVAIYVGGGYTPGTAQYVPASGASLAGVTKDATSGIYCPASATEWASVMAVAGISSGGPSVLYLMQEASGNIADSIGTFTGTAGGTGLSYQNAVSGWTRLAINTTDAGTGTFTNSSASLPDPASASLLMIAYVKTTSAAANHGVLQISGTTIGQAQMTAAGLGRIVVGGNSAPGSSDSRGQVRPWVLKHNFTASAQALYTDQDKIVPTFAALSGKNIRVGATSSTAITASYLYAVVFFGSAAELSDAQIKTLLQTLGWSPAWSFLFKPRPANDNAWTDGAAIAA